MDEGAGSMPGRNVAVVAAVSTLAVAYSQPSIAGERSPATCSPATAPLAQIPRTNPSPIADLFCVVSFLLRVVSLNHPT